MSTRAKQLRVVVFTGGAVLENDCIDFIAELEERHELIVCGVFCESASAGLRGVFIDLWTRRRWLAPILFAQRVLRRCARIAFSPVAEIRRRRSLRRLKQRIFVVADLHANTVLTRVAELDPDIGAVYGGPVLRQALFDIPAEGTLGIHHGRLPHYRGKKTTFWAMFNGEDSVGVAIQKIGSRLDGGAILRDARLPVGRMPPCVVSRRLHRVGLDLYLEALLSIRDGTAVFQPQAPASDPLYRDPLVKDIVRFWFKYFARLVSSRAAERKSGA